MHGCIIFLFIVYAFFVFLYLKNCEATIESLPSTDILRTLRDPEKDATLEDLEVIQEDRIKVGRTPKAKGLIKVGLGLSPT